MWKTDLYRTGIEQFVIDIYVYIYQYYIAYIEVLKEADILYNTDILTQGKRKCTRAVPSQR